MNLYLQYHSDTNYGCHKNGHYYYVVRYPFRFVIINITNQHFQSYHILID